MEVWGEWMDDGGWMFGWINANLDGGWVGDRGIHKGGVFQRGNIMHKAAESGACLEWIIGWVDGC